MLKMKKYLLLVAVLLLAAATFPGLSPAASAQTPQQPEGMTPEMEKKYKEFIDGEIRRLENTLKLEPWQTFYVDSILHHDYDAMQDELNQLRLSKVSNVDIYTSVKDKWNERMYEAIRNVLDEAQWKKYLKGGAEKEQRAREKRKARSENATKK